MYLNDSVEPNIETVDSGEKDMDNEPAENAETVPTTIL